MNNRMISPRECSTIQFINPDGTVSTGGIDQSMDESGSLLLGIGQSVVSVNFSARKASDDYRFEYLYVEADGVINPGTINPVPVIQTMFGFSVDLAGVPPVDGYVLNWRVVVKTLQSSGANIDAPENIYQQLPQGTLFLVTFNNERSTAQYGFSELRVENLVDPPANQVAVIPQVVVKTVFNFTVLLTPAPTTDSYFLVARTP